MNETIETKSFKELYEELPKIMEDFYAEVRIY